MIKKQHISYTDGWVTKTTKSLYYTNAIPSSKLIFDEVSKGFKDKTKVEKNKKNSI